MNIRLIDYISKISHIKFLHGILIIFLISILTFFKILQAPAGIPIHGDMSFATTLDNYINDFYPLYNPYGSVSNYEDIDRSFIMLPIFLFSKIIGLEIEWFVKLWLLLIFISSGISFYIFIDYLLEKIYRKKISIIILLPGIIIFMLNPWVLEQLQAPFYWLAYSLTPMILFGFMKVIEEKNNKYIFLVVILWTIISATPHYMIFTGILLFLYLILHLVNNDNRKYDIYRIFKISCLIILLFVSINSYWMIPFFLNSRITEISPGYTVTQEQVEIFSRNSNFLNVIRTMDQWINWYNPSIYKKELWVINSFLIVILSLSIIFIKYLRKNFYVRFFFLIYIISVLASLGTNFPGYLWLIFDSPISNNIGWVWRVPGKLSYLIWLIYAIFISIFIYEIISKRRLTIRNYDASRYIIALIFISFLFLSGPKMLNYFGFYYIPVEIPKEYQDLNGWLNNRSGDFKVMDLAPYDKGSGRNIFRYESSYTWNKNRIAGHLVPRSLKKDSIGFYHYTSPWRKFYSLFYPETSKDISIYMQIAGIKYLIYHDDILGTKKQANIDISNLNKSGLELVKRFGFIYVYENKNDISRIYIPKNILLSTSSLKEIEFSDILSGYIFINQNINKPYLLEIMNQTNNKIYYKNIDELALSMIPKEYRIEPFRYTYRYKANEYWSRYKIFSPYEGKYPWHMFLSWRNIDDKYYFDFNEGVIFTYATGANISIPVEIKDNDIYDIYIRMLISRAGGKLEFILDNQTFVIDSKYESDDIIWNKLSTTYLSSGKHILQIRNIDGVNIINVIVPINPKKFEEYKNILKGYINENNTKNEFVSDLKLDKINNDINHNNEFNIYNHNDYIVVTTNSTKQSSWSNIELDSIGISPGKYILSIYMKRKNAKQSHIHVRNYFDDGTFKMNTVCPKDGNSQWKNFRCLLEIPENVHKIQLILNAGWIQNKNLGNAITEFKDIKIIPSKIKTEDIFKVDSIPAIVENYTKIDPTLYKTKINATKPFMISFAESYDPLWIAKIDKINGKYINSEVIRPIPLYSVVNGFWINQTGDLDITIEYEPQRWFYIGAAISITTLIICIGYLVYDWRRKKTN